MHNAADEQSAELYRIYQGSGSRLKLAKKETTFYECVLLWQEELNPLIFSNKRIKQWNIHRLVKSSGAIMSINQPSLQRAAGNQNALKLNTCDLFWKVCLRCHLSSFMTRERC